MACLVCGAQEVKQALDLGSQPVASFFLPERDTAEHAVDLALGQCATCGTIQLMKPVSHQALIPPYDWLFAREPEEHLDQVVEQIVALPGVTTDCVIGALTSKDDTTIDRFRRKGFARTWRVTLDGDLGVANPACGIETVQRLTTPERMTAIADRHGAADVLIVRHILEHAENLHDFVAGIAALVKPGGIVMVEIPDCTNSLRLHDYCMPWEEHSLYFTPETFAPVLTLGGFEPIRMDVFPLPFENSIVQLARKIGAPGPVKLDQASAARKPTLLAGYAADFEPTRRDLRIKLAKFRSEQGPIALFGAGHLACAFANFLGVADLIDFVADDTPQKIGKYLPGARMPILPSAALAERGVKLCLLALSVSSEDRVIERNSAVTAAGGKFASILRASPRSIFSLAL
ncbi:MULTISPECIES: methyltransferase domain-containing protein [unclassified Bradyrhizobium]|uniref:methyltransferase domain-containing protein n=1 Tax=unclassified Bradyrhizobium TaxID=2631580 RepID=UPI0029168B8F|nr:MULTISPECIES: methyltransferase domain-containing protein [unclassified Bradyrhizobium]